MRSTLEIYGYIRWWIFFKYYSFGCETASSLHRPVGSQPPREKVEHLKQSDHRIQKWVRTRVIGFRKRVSKQNRNLANGNRKYIPQHLRLGVVIDVGGSQLSCLKFLASFTNCSLIHPLPCCESDLEIRKMTFQKRQHLNVVANHFTNKCKFTILHFWSLSAYQ